MVKLENVSLAYTQGKNILKNITLDIGDGECILLTGKSGSGKSSLINLINGLVFDYDEVSITGDIKINEQSIRNLPLYAISRQVSSVFQNPKTHFFNINTTLELLFYLENIGLDRAEMEKRMNNMLKIFPIEHLLGRRIFDLSGGEKQILSVASCYISGCKIMVLDEPSSNLDEQSINILVEMLKILKVQGMTLILAEHRLYYLMGLVDRVVLIQNGMIEWCLSKDAFLAMSHHQLVQWGLRSTRKPVLQKKPLRPGKDVWIQNLEYIFPNQGRWALQNVGFDLGHIYGIVGQNGCGKSTFLRVMTGLDKKGQGEIFFQGRLFKSKERLKQSSLVMQDVNHQLLTHGVEEEIQLGIRPLDQNKVDDILNGLSLMALKDRHPMSLSGGQKQRVAIGSVLCKNPKWIFFDEPTSGMDEHHMLEISQFIKKMINKDNVIFIVSHDTEFLNLTVDQILCLEDFRQTHL